MMCALLLAVGAEESLNAAGWVIMLISVTFVLSLTFFCFWRVLRDSGANRASDDDPVGRNS